VAVQPPIVARPLTLPPNVSLRRNRKDEENQRPRSVIRNFTNRRYRHRGVVDEVERTKNRWKYRIRAKVEHGIGVNKRVFAFTKCSLPEAGEERPSSAPCMWSRQSVHRSTSVTAGLMAQPALVPTP
jgi:hypothetical protein